MNPPTPRDDADLFRREAMGAFAHEVRTPLTSIKMVMELAKRQGSHGQLVLDTELSEMLLTSVEDLQELADQLQETSRLERGRITLSTGPCELGAVIEAARELTRGIEVDGAAEGDIRGPWDAAGLVRAVSGLVVSANRIGDGSGRVAIDVHCSDRLAELVFTSGTPSGEPKPIAADAGFSFFMSRQLVLAMGGSVDCDRADRFATFRVTLPLDLDGDGFG